MEENKKIEKTAETAEQTAHKEDTGKTVELGKPYTFEEKEYKSVDMSGLDKLTIKDAIDAQSQLFGEQEVATALLCETTTAFAREIAAKATGLPIEFFKLLHRAGSRKIAQAVRGYLNSEQETENHIITFDKPHIFKGKEYTQVDLNGIADLTSMNESEAENRLARAGFVITETSTNYLFACILASMATGEPEEFFTSLPLRELVKLKNAVNDAGFFE